MQLALILYPTIWVALANICSQTGSIDRRWSPRAPVFPAYVFLEFDSLFRECKINSNLYELWHIEKLVYYNYDSNVTDFSISQRKQKVYRYYFAIVCTSPNDHAAGFWYVELFNSSLWIFVFPRVLKETTVSKSLSNFENVISVKVLVHFRNKEGSQQKFRSKVIIRRVMY